MDDKVTIDQLKTAASRFIEERDWWQYQTLKNISMDATIEAAELMELFLWHEDKDSLAILEKRRKEIENEVADVLFSILKFSVVANIDLSSAFESKMALNAQKYPINTFKGKSDKYTRV